MAHWAVLQSRSNQKSAARGCTSVCEHLDFLKSAEGATISPTTRPGKSTCAAPKSNHEKLTRERIRMHCYAGAAPPTGGRAQGSTSATTARRSPSPHAWMCLSARSMEPGLATAPRNWKAFAVDHIPMGSICGAKSPLRGLCRYSSQTDWDRIRIQSLSQEHEV